MGQALQNAVWICVSGPRALARSDVAWEDPSLRQPVSLPVREDHDRVREGL